MAEYPKIAPIRSEKVFVRITPGQLEKLESYGRSYGLTNAAGVVDISAVLRDLAAMSIDDFHQA